MENDKNKRKAPETPAPLPDGALRGVAGGWVGADFFGDEEPNVVFEEANDVLLRSPAQKWLDDGSYTHSCLKRAYQK